MMSPQKVWLVSVSGALVNLTRVRSATSQDISCRVLKRSQVQLQDLAARDAFLLFDPDLLPLYPDENRICRYG